MPRHKEAPLNPRSRAVLRHDIFWACGPLAGYASLKLCHVMSCFLYEKHILCYGWLGYACCPPQPQMMQGMPAFWAPAGPQPGRLTWGRKRARQRLQKKKLRKSSPQASPETQMQQSTVNNSVLWLGSRARARRPEKPMGKKQGPCNSKTDRRTTNRSAKQSLTVFTAFCRARAQHRRHARQRLAPKCAKMSLAYIPPIPSKKQCFMG